MDSEGGHPFEPRRGGGTFEFSDGMQKRSIGAGEESAEGPLVPKKGISMNQFVSSLFTGGKH